MSLKAAPAKAEIRETEDIFLMDGTPAIFGSHAGKKLVQMIQRVAPYPTAVLITGETGCGKEVVARGLHLFSLRHNKPLIDVSCAAIPEHLIESELFGYDKGAFSGADQSKPGFFEMANEGSLFMDEVGELDARVQVKLLRVLDGASYFRLGGNKKVNVNVRIIAATNRNLEEEVEKGRFRRDLYHRLSQIQLQVPPLRERTEDIEALALYYLKQHKPGASLSEEAIQALMKYSWPGNIRELRNVMVNLAVMSESLEPLIESHHLPPEISLIPAETISNGGEAIAGGGGLEEMERRMILQALQRNSGDQGQAAEQLGISRRTLSRKLKLYEGREIQPVEADGNVIGQFDPRQQQFFRATMVVDAALKCGMQTQKVRTANVSIGGLAIAGVMNDLETEREISISFKLPEWNTPIVASADLSWLDGSGRAGLRFKSVEGQEELQRWIQSQLQREGWEPYRRDRVL